MSIVYGYVSLPYYVMINCCRVLVYRSEYSQWFHERQILLLLSYLSNPHAMGAPSNDTIHNILLATKRYSVVTLLSGAWLLLKSRQNQHDAQISRVEEVITDDNRKNLCTARELLVWLSKEMELKPHNTDDCTYCNHFITSYKAGRRKI